MRGYLLDTNIVLLAALGPEQLSPNAKAAMQAGPAWLSVVSFWEIVLKAGKGKLEIGNPRTWWQEAQQQLHASILLLRLEHIAAVCDLASIHQDPFDRALIAQATVEDLTLVSQDRQMRAYRSDHFRLVQ